jgi:hypothetical protein
MELLKYEMNLARLYRTRLAQGEDEKPVQRKLRVARLGHANYGAHVPFSIS